MVEDAGEGMIGEVSDGVRHSVNLPARGYHVVDAAQACGSGPENQRDSAALKIRTTPSS
jgi:hypothetical protein